MRRADFHVEFEAAIQRPGGAYRGEGWTFLRLPQEASDPLPSRGMVPVEGTLNGAPFLSVLEPDGEGGHWLRITPELGAAAHAKVGDRVRLTIGPATTEPEPNLPRDVRDALDGASVKAIETWQNITPSARRDWIAWIVAAKKPETRIKRISVALDKLDRGDRRPCCFDRSGKYSKDVRCPVPDEAP